MTLKPVFVRKIDYLAPPILFAGMYFYLFGLGAFDVSFFQDSDAWRAWRYIFAWHGISQSALYYIFFGYIFFILGYYLFIGSVIAKPILKITSAYTFDHVRSFIVPAALFLVAIFVQIWISQHYVFTSIPGLISTGEQLSSDISFLTIVGDLVSMAYSFNIWRFMLSKGTKYPKMSTPSRWFLFGVIVPIMTASLIYSGSRSKIAYVVFATLLAYHYGYRRVRARAVIFSGLVILLVISPMIAFLRIPETDKLTFDSPSSLAVFSWDVVFRRTTSLESFTVTFENLETAPNPDPLWFLVASPIPRVFWPSKPFGTLMPRFSIWSTGQAATMLTPSLPGEFMLHFGFIGGLLAMFFLGILWRIAFVALIGFKQIPSAAGFIYILLLPVSLQAIEGGFVIEYGALLRLLLVGLFVFGLGTRPRTLHQKADATVKQPRTHVSDKARPSATLR